MSLISLIRGVMVSNPWPAGFPAWAALYILSKPYKAARGVSYGTIPVIQPRMEQVTMGEEERKKSRRSTLSDHSRLCLPLIEEIQVNGSASTFLWMTLVIFQNIRNVTKIEGDGSSLV